MDTVPPHLPQYPTRSQLLERHWFEFLKFQQSEIRKRLQSGFGVPKVDFSEQAFWEYYVNERMDSDAS